MYLDHESIRQNQRSMGSMPLTLAWGEYHPVVYWARLIEGRSESLLTGCTKHTIYEIEYALFRPLVIRLNDQTLTLNDGEFLIIPPETTHQIIRSDPEGYKFILGFSLDPHQPALHAEKTLTDTPALRGIIQLIPAILESGSRELLQSIMQSAFLAFLDACPLCTAEWAHRDEGERSLQRFLDFVRSAHGVGVSVRECARLISLSERQLLRCCLAVTGKTPSEIIQQERLNFIRTCLQQTHLSLSEIADLAGFQTESAMARFFQKKEGLLPSFYRRQKSPASLS